MSVPRLYVPGLDPRSGVIALPAGESHHVTRVLRLRSGDRVRVFDGEGREWSARLAATERGAVARVEHLEAIAAAPEPRVRVTLAAGLLKGDHMDAVVRDATMMGAAKIVPLATEFVTVPARAWQGGAALDRWRRVAVASAKQCGRAVVPEVTAPVTLEQVLVDHGRHPVVMFVEPAAGADTRPVSGLDARGASALLVLIGPEGGWSPAEIDQARPAGAMLAHLGPRTIRADAMATAALGAMQVLFDY